MPSSRLSRSTSSHTRGPADRVEAGGRLVEEQHLGVVHQRGGEVEAALHAARVAWRSAGRGRRRCRSSSPSSLDAPVGIAARQPVQPALQPQQLAPGLLGVERASCSATPMRRRTSPGSSTTSKPATVGRAARRGQQRAEHPHGRRLAGAVRAEEAVDLAAPDLEVDAGDGVVVAEVADQGAGPDGGIVIVGGHGASSLPGTTNGDTPSHRAGSRRCVNDGAVNWSPHDQFTDQCPARAFFTRAVTRPTTRTASPSTTPRRRLDPLPRLTM